MVFKRKAQLGFSMIELMVIVAIFGVMTAVAVPNFLRWQENEQLKASARTVSDAFQFARTEAIRTGNNFMVVVDGSLSSPNDIAVVDDGPQATADCNISAGEVVFSKGLGTGISFGVSQQSGPYVAAPGDTGNQSASIPAGSTFDDSTGSAAKWVLFQNDGLPRTFEPVVGSCNSLGQGGEGGGGIYVTNGNRDYGVVLSPLGTARVHRWQPTGGWSS